MEDKVVEYTDEEIRYRQLLRKATNGWRLKAEDMWYTIYISELVMKENKRPGSNRLQYLPRGFVGDQNDVKREA